jgi:hypothetical protein
MVYCTASNSKATVYIEVENNKQKVVSYAPPITVNLSLVRQTAQVYGQGIDVPTCGPLGNLTTREFNGVVSFVAGTAFGCPASRFLLNGVDQGNSESYYPTPTIVRQYSEKWVLKVDDLNGNLFIQEYQNQPTYSVICGDECPPGYCKCECKNYPGYCCYDKNGNPL